VVAVEVSIRLLGSTEVGNDGQLSPRDRVVLSALCLQPGQVVPAEVLADALWGEVPPKSWVKVLQGSVMRLRRLLGPSAIETTAGGYRIVVPPGLLDTVEFEHLVERGRSFLALNEPQRAATTFDQALRLWRGPPFPELVDWDRGRSEGARLLELRRAVEEDLVDAQLAAGRAADAAAGARSLVAREPLRERRWALLATALYRLGQQGDALDVLRGASRTLREELGLDPGPELARLERRILQQDPSLLAVPNRIGGASATCPYRGLRPFEPQDADFYFGRGVVAAEAVRRLEECPFLVVVGASGSGKSSLVRAGLLPALADAGHRPTVLAPGADPAAALASAIAELADDGVLVVDQLEEVFAPTVDRQVTRQFLDRLAGVAGAGTRVVTTLRADRLDSMALSTDLSRLAERGLMLLTPMTEDELREAIEAPAALAGLVLEPGLVDLLLRDVTGAPGALPLLSHALAETWERRDGTVMTVEGYRATGGIASAVAQSAERLYESLPPPDRQVLRTVLQRLVVPAPSGEPVAVRVSTRVFAGSPDAPRVLDLLVRSRLVTTAEDTVTVAHESLVRAWPRLRSWLDEDVEGQRVLAHLQAAADGWDALGRPDDELYRGARLAAAREWSERARPVLTPVETDFIATSVDTADAEILRRQRDHAGQVRRNRQLRGALGAVIVLLAVALVAGTVAGRAGRTARAEAARAAAEAGRANASAVAAIGDQLAATALSGPDAGLSMLLARQAVDIHDGPETQGALLDRLVNAQGLVGVAQSRRGASTATFDDAFTPDGRVLLHQDDLFELDLLDTATGVSLYGPLADTGARSSVNLSGYPAGLVDGGRTVVLSHEGTPAAGGGFRRLTPIGLLPIDVGTGEAAGPRQRVPGAVRVSGDLPDHADHLRISPDGTHLVSVLEGRVRIWQRRGGHWVGPVSLPIPGLDGGEAMGTQLVGATFSTSGSRAAVLFDVGWRDRLEPVTAATIHEPGGVVVDLARARLLGVTRLPNREGALSHMAVSPDGTTVLIGDPEGVVLVRDVVDNSVLSVLPGRSPATISAWSPDGDRVAVGRLDGSTEVYSLDPLQRIMMTEGADQVSALAFVGDHGLLSESVSGSIARYDLATVSSVMTSATTVPIHSLAAAAGLLAQGGVDGRITIRDQRTLEQVGEPLRLGPYSEGAQASGPDAGRRAAAVSLAGDGSAVVAADQVGHLRMWSLPERRQLWARDDVPTSWLTLSPDGRFLVTAGYRDVPVGLPPTTVTVWDLRTHSLVHRQDFTAENELNATVDPLPSAIALSPAGNDVAVAYPNGFMLIYHVDQRRRTPWVTPQPDAPLSMVFSPDGTQLIAASPDYLTVRDSSTGRPVRRTYVPGLRDVTRMAYTDGGRWLVLSRTRSLTVLDAATLRVAAEVPVPSGASTEAIALAAGEDHRLLVGTDTALVAVDMDPERWKTAACAVVGRRLTREEWDRFLPSMPYAPACTSSSAGAGGSTDRAP
jgi:DNA-binding SARP family transcriptional activator/WD40 repeat protein